jgi:hypothetical protein
MGTIERVDVVQEELVRMNESEIEVERSQQDLFGGHHFVTQVPVFLRTRSVRAAGGVL